MPVNHRYNDCDFAGWVTKNDIVCADGAVIKSDAFKDQDGQKIPLVWQHNGTASPDNVLGHVYLENRPEGVYGYGYFNDLPKSVSTKALLQHGDVSSMSIGAKVKRRRGRDVYKGKMHEVSIVLAGANPGAMIETVLTHSDSDEEVVNIYTDNLIHAMNYPDDQMAQQPQQQMNYQQSNEQQDGGQEDDEQLIKDIQNSLTEEELAELYSFIKQLVGPNVPDEQLMDNLTEEQLNAISDKMIEILERDEQEPQQGGQSQSQQMNQLQHSDNQPITEEELVNMIADAFDEEEFKRIFEYAKKIAGPNIPDDKVMDSLDKDKMAKLSEFIMSMLDEDDENDEGEDEEMKHYLFANQGEVSRSDILEHSATKANILAGITQYGTLRNSMIQNGVEATIDDFLQHGITTYGENDEEVLQHGINDVETLFTQEVFDKAPEMYKAEEDSIIDHILNGVHTTPKHTVRKRYSDLTDEEAIANGYIKQDEKIEFFWGVFDRVTSPQTIYVKQTLEEDDIVDIDWDIVQYQRSVMRYFWRRDVSKAIFIGDGRLTSSRQKIKETCVRPIMKDDPFYAVPVYDVTPENFLDKIITAMAEKYKGTGTPELFTDKVMFAKVRLLRKDNGGFVWGDRPISKSEFADLAGVKSIQEPHFLSGTNTHCIVNLDDYEVASPNKGKSKTYEQFDIDVNQHKYLLEGRIAGALVQPKGALVLTSAPAPADDETHA